MRRKWWIFLVAPPLFVLCIFLGGEIVKLLWNWLLPPLLGLHQINFWQGLGILVLARILFGGIGGRGPSHRSNFRGRMLDRMADRMADRWEQMTPEERERFRERIRGRCGFGPFAAREQPAE